MSAAWWAERWVAESVEMMAEPWVGWKAAWSVLMKAEVMVESWVAS